MPYVPHETESVVTLEPSRPASATVILMHGLGADGHDFVPIVEELRLPDTLPVRFVFPSSVAVYGLPDVEAKTAAGRVKEEDWNVPITMYGCNKLYCEHLGRYFTQYFRQLGALSGAARLDFRSIRFTYNGARRLARSGTSGPTG